MEGQTGKERQNERQMERESHWRVLNETFMLQATLQ